MLQVQEVRVSMPLAAASAVTPSQHSLLKAAVEAAAPVAVPRVFLGRTAGAVLWGFPAALCACSLGGALDVLGRWISGEGSAVAGAGEAILANALLVVMPLFSLFLLLSTMRAFAYFKFVFEEEKGKKQCPERDAEPLLPKLKPIAIFLVPLNALMYLAIWMKLSAEEGSLRWRMGAVLLDTVLLCCSVFIAFVLVPNTVILMKIPSQKDEGY